LPKLGAVTSLMLSFLLLCLPQVAVSKQLPVHQELTQADWRAAAKGQGRFLFTASNRFRSVGVWSSRALDGVRIARAQPHGQTPTAWALVGQPELTEVPGFPGPAGQRWVSALVHFPRSQSSSVVLSLPPSLALKALQGDLDCALVWVPENPIAESPPPQSRAVGKPSVYTRASWGADPPQCSAGYCTTTHVAMHHTASASEYGSTSWSECANNVQAIQAYHMYTRGWCDIGYNYLICPHGDIFEGRGGGDDVVGAHDSANCGSMGVAFMGYFHSPHHQSLTQAMQNAFVDLAAWKCDQQNIDPLGSAWYAGYGANMNTIYGHRDVSSTACPGDLAYANLPQLRVQIEQKIQSGGSVDLILDNASASYFGTWNTGTSAAGKYGSDYRWASTGTALARAFWEPSIPQSGTYEVSLWWPAGSNRSPQTPIGLFVGGRLYQGSVNQQQAGGQWNVLGQVQFAAGAMPVLGIENTGPSGFVVVADALRLRKL
jgi:hypothetical protein